MPDIKTILFPVDFTDSSRKVLPYVKLFAEKFGARLHLIHVVRGAEDFAGFEMGAAWFSAFEKELMDGASKAMERFVENELGPDNGVETQIAMGDVVEEVVAYAERCGADLIIIGTHGRKGLEKIMFGLSLIHI